MVAEGYMYLPSLGLYFAFAAWCSSLLTSPGAKTLAGVGLGMAMVALIGATYSRCVVWKDSFSLWDESSPNIPARFSIITENTKVKMAGRSETSTRPSN